MHREYSDVEYLGRTFLDAELIGGKWYFEDVHGKSDTPREAGGLMGWAASKAVDLQV